MGTADGWLLMRLRLGCGAISSCADCAVVVVSCCATDWSGYFVSIVISESTRTALECTLRCDYSRDANLWRSKIWRFFPADLSTPPPSINLPTPPPLLFPPPPLNAPTHSPAAPSAYKNILPPLWICGKTGYLCQEFLLVNRRSNQTIGYMAMIAKGSHFV